MVAEHQAHRRVHPPAADHAVCRHRALSVYLLSLAMRTLPVGTAYAVFTGIGAVGAIVLGVLVHKDPLSAARALALSMIVGGIVLARFTTPG